MAIFAAMTTWKPENKMLSVLTDVLKPTTPVVVTNGIVSPMTVNPSGGGPGGGGGGAHAYAYIG